MKQQLKQLLYHPLTAGALLVSTLGQLGFGLFDPLWGVISMTSGYWYPAIAASAATIFPEIGLADVKTPVLVAATVLYVTVLADKGIDRAQAYFENR
ncbi:hypothetical protein [Haloarcula amylovorans]|uniref:hypothetical protein n=1 Tax=Haloarcula amylovorans TaxID=2562280 RepID=UPI001076955F|nr:hypothetical protein [Halomicroarcula amylolytica]